MSYVPEYYNYCEWGINKSSVSVDAECQRYATVKEARKVLIAIMNQEMENIKEAKRKLRKLPNSFFEKD